MAFITSVLGSTYSWLIQVPTDVLVDNAHLAFFFFFLARNFVSYMHVVRGGK